MQSHARVHYTEVCRKRKKSKRIKLFRPIEEEKILNWNQGEHCCQEPGCDFACRAALTLVRHQVNLNKFGRVSLDPISGESAWHYYLQKPTTVWLPPLPCCNQRWKQVLQVLLMHTISWTCMFG